MHCRDFPNSIHFPGILGGVEGEHLLPFQQEVQVIVVVMVQTTAASFLSVSHPEVDLLRDQVPCEGWREG